MANKVSSPIYEASIKDNNIECSCGTNAVIVVLPSNKCGKGELTISKVDSGANAVTITPASGETWDEATLQKETATVAGTVTGAGNATVVITAAGLDTMTFSVPVHVDETAAIVAASIRRVLKADPVISSLWTVSGTAAYVVLTQRNYYGNDSTLNISVDNGTCTGLTTAGTSANTTAGTAITLAAQYDTINLANDGTGWVIKSKTGANLSETLTNKVLTDARLNFSIGTHSYGSAHADWTLSAAELLKTVHKPTAADQAVNAIIPTTAGKPYVFINGTGQALTVKTAAGTGVAITNGKTAIVMADGTNVIALATESA